MSRDTALQIWLKSWAEWFEHEGGGFSSATVIYHYFMNQLQGEFGSRIPNGVCPPRSLERIVLHMNKACIKRKNVRYIYAMKIKYLIGIQGAAYKLERPIRTVRRWSTRGEDILRRELRSA